MSTGDPRRGRGVAVSARGKRVTEAKIQRAIAALVEASGSDVPRLANARHCYSRMKEAL